MPDSPPILWHFQGSHYCEKARWALDYKGVPHVRKVLARSYLLRAWWSTGKAALPVLWLDGRAIGGSGAIVRALEERFEAAPLYPADAAERERALQLEAYFDEHLGHAVRAAALSEVLVEHPEYTARFATMGLGPTQARVLGSVAPVFARFYRTRHGIDPADVARARDQVNKAMDRIHTEVGPAGYLAGDGFSIADLTACSLLAAIVPGAELEYPLPEPMPDPMVRYRQEIRAHPTAEWVLDVFAKHRGHSSQEVLS